VTKNFAICLTARAPPSNLAVALTGRRLPPQAFSNGKAADGGGRSGVQHGMPVVTPSFPGDRLLAGPARGPLAGGADPFSLPLFRRSPERARGRGGAGRRVEKGGRLPGGTGRAGEKSAGIPASAGRHSRFSECFPAITLGPSGNPESLPAVTSDPSGNSDGLRGITSDPSGNSDGLPGITLGLSGNSEPFPAFTLGHSENSEWPTGSFCSPPPNP
jgi:hypothetical protein